MKVDNEAIKHIASLARLSISASEAKRYQKDIEEVLKAFDVLNSMPAECEPSFQPVVMSAGMREDKKEKCFTQEEALANTKHKEKGFFRGPKAV
jgi:aspartyl-tRNA(Asn)/glutamyl-tRNA(Gln) amidotransferase subunit C